MRTTVNIDEYLLAEARLLAVRSRRPMGSILEEALRRYLNERGREDEGQPAELPEFKPTDPGLRPGVDLDDREQIAELLGENDAGIR
ncbi:type II toxin-antitoxin system VapB family antitoxin [Pseudactinotalea sp. HY158]|uniref:type II toxin-antitoxin system VapB family antitoxin n=1 Tax=Pseudactinotalea sp. HY158 TaxID=2654547 RepID=UPI001891FC67|nr:type II toxin-antitoxin system VapB family antitoxin [Pseudactinotalea sp. HY158]